MYAEAVNTVDPFKCVGKLHSLWVEFAKLYEKSGFLEEARKVFKRVRAPSSLEGAPKSGAPPPPPG